MGGGSGGGGTSTTVQKADPWEGVQPYLIQGYSQLANLYGNGKGPQYYPGSTVAATDPNVAWGQSDLLSNLYGINNAGYNALNASNSMYGGANAALGAGSNYYGLGAAGMSNAAGAAQNAAQNYQYLGANGMSNAASNAVGGLDIARQSAQGLNAAANPANNPYFQSALSSAIRPVTQQFNEQVLPGIKGAAQDAGQFGGSRQGIAEGLASRSYMDTVGDISSNMGNAAYAQGLQAQAQAGQLGAQLGNTAAGLYSGLGSLGAQLGGQAGSMYGTLGNLGANIYQTGLTGLGQNQALAQGVQGALQSGGNLISGIGQQRTDAAQQQLNDSVNRYNYQQNLPYTMVQDYLAALNGAQGGMTTSQQSGGGGSRGAGALGGALSGGALGGMVAGASSGAIGGPLGMGVGAGLGALYGLFM